MRLLPCLIASGSAAVLAVAVALSGATAPATVAAPARVSHAAPHPARFISEARAALVRYLSHDHPQAMGVHTGRARRPVPGTTKVTSTNWSGYVDVSTTTGTFTRVSGSWATPGVACGAEDQITSNWVGLDGYTNSTVEQLGTISWCYEGSPIYFTWYEMYPAGTVEVGRTLKAGDKIAASVTRRGASYTLKLTDSTNSANSFSHTATCATSTCKDLSAEWISERPSFSIGTVPQAHYNAFKITHGAETANGKSGTIGSFARNDAITMIDATQAYDLNAVSKLSGGNSFTTTWQNSY